MTTKDDGDFSIGGKLWPGTGQLLEKMGNLQQVLGQLIGSCGDGDLHLHLKEGLADLEAAIQFFRETSISVEEDAWLKARTAEKLIAFRRRRSEVKGWATSQR